MKKRNRAMLGTLCAAAIAGPFTPALASSVNNSIFEEVKLFNRKTFFTDTFNIEDEGIYKATLTDFEFPKPLKNTGLTITTATDTIGTLFGPGSFTFDADPGDYYISFYAKASGNQDRKREKDRGSRRERDADKPRKPREEKRNTSQRTNKAAAEKRHDWDKRYWDSRADFASGPGYAPLMLGQYGIEISHDTSAVPVPAAAWLFGSGLIGLVGVARRRNTRINQFNHCTHISTLQGVNHEIKTGTHQLNTWIGCRTPGTI